MRNNNSHWPISILSGFSSLVNMLLPLALVRWLAPAEVGQFKIFFLYLMIFPAFSMTTGLINGLYYWAGRADSRERAIRLSLSLIFWIALIAGVVALAAQPLLSARFGWSEVVAWVFAASLVGAIASPAYEESSIARGRIWAGALFGSSFDFLRTFAILIAAFLTRSLTVIFVAHAALSFLKSVAGYARAGREGFFSPKLFRRGTRDDLRAVWAYAFPVSLAWALGVFINSADQVILSGRLAASEFAVYAVGCLSVPPLLVLEHSITRVLIPRLSEYFAEDRSGEAARLYRDTVDELAFLMIPAVTGMIVFASPIVNLLFTSTYAAAAGYLRIYALSYLALIIPYDSVARARGQGRWILANYVSFSLLSVALVFALVRPFGPYGALAGGLAARLLMRVHGLSHVRHETSWRLSEYLPLKGASVYTSACVALGVLACVLESRFRSGLVSFLVLGPAFTVGYFAITLYWRAHRMTESRRICMLTQYLGLGGLERMILNLSLELKRVGEWEPSVFVFDHDDSLPPESHLVPVFENHGIPVQVCKKPRGFSPRVVLRICRYIAQENISVLHTHDLGALIYGVFAKLFCFRKLRLIHTQHSFVHLGRNPRYRVYERLFTRFVDELTVVSEDTARSYRELGVPKSKIHVVPNGVRFPAELSSQSPLKRRLREDLLVVHAPDRKGAPHPLRGRTDAVWAIYLSRVHGGKGQDQALKVWRELSPDTRAKTCLLFLGAETEAGRLAKLEEGIRALPSSDSVFYLGATQDPQAWLDAADLYISCSEFEGMPLGPVEAAGSGLPMLLSDIAGHAMLGHFAELYPLDRPSEGARKLEAWAEKLSKDGMKLRESLWARSQEIRDRFSVQAMGARYASFYGGKQE